MPIVIRLSPQELVVMGGKQRLISLLLVFLVCIYTMKLHPD